jgi:hypothetical protein
MPLQRLRRLRTDEEGVASTVGTIMALLVILTFMSLIVNQYVPVWSKDSEAAHMNTALGQFGAFKSNVDTQVLGAIIAQQSGRQYIPVATYSPVTLGLDGVPIFASPTIGGLAINPVRGNWTVEFRYVTSGTTLEVTQRSQGRIVLAVANRYHIPQDIAYENGAIILAQRDGEAVRVDPQFRVTRTGSAMTLAFAQVKLFGEGSIQGTATEGIRSKVMGADPQLYTGLSGDVYINGTTRFGAAWYRFFNKTFSTSFNISSSNYDNDPVNFRYFKGTGGETVETPYFILSYAGNATSDYTVNLMVINSPGLPIIQFELDQAFVNVAVGQVGKGTEV